MRKCSSRARLCAGCFASLMWFMKSTTDENGMRGDMANCSSAEEGAPSKAEPGGCAKEPLLPLLLLSSVLRRMDVVCPPPLPCTYRQGSSVYFPRPRSPCEGLTAERQCLQVGQPAIFLYSTGRPAVGGV